MFISMNWISDFVDLSGIDKGKLIQQFSLSTAEVESEIYYKGKDLSGVVVGEIVSIEDHPDSKKLHLLKVDMGDETPVDVVCGAPNVRVGLKTAFAQTGAHVGDIVIAPCKVAGQLSNGMCCSEKEIGISDNHDGIMEIGDQAVNGTDIKELYQIEDIVFEVDNKSLTNRPDLWGHYGIAREIAALANRPLKPMEVTALSAYDNLPKVDLKILDPLCQRYSALQIDNIKTNISPVNMRIRLYYCGMRAINLLADLTNYLMLEMGQPMHAFDARKVGKIRIRRFDKPFTFQTLDGVERNIDENTLMICNDETPVAIAGIMGGMDSEIVEDTTTLTLESATFDPVSIRKSTVRLSHRTDASMRYEKSLDPEMTVTAIARFVKLLTAIDPGAQVVSALTDEYAFHYPKVELAFDKAYVDRYTGIEIDKDTICQTLTALGFLVRQSGGVFDVTVPSWRSTKDVTVKADIIEEITRIYGYDNFDIHTTIAPLNPVRVAPGKTVEEKVKDLLVKRYSLHELHSYVWAYYDDYKELGIEVEDNVKLLNASSPNIETIRRSIVPTQFCQVKNNVNFAPGFGIFEIGRVVDGVDADTNLCREQKKLAITLYSKADKLEDLYFKARDIVAVLADDIRHASVSFRAKQAAHSYQHPKNLNDILCGGEVIGEIGIAHPYVTRKIDKKASIVYVEIDMEALTAVENGHIAYEEPSRYPGMEIDLSFLADRFEQIKAGIDAVKSALIRKVAVIDTYSGDSGKSITVRLTFAHPERTLTSEEVMEVVNGMIAHLEKQNVSLKK